MVPLKSAISGSFGSHVFSQYALVKTKTAFQQPSLTVVCSLFVNSLCLFTFVKDELKKKKVQKYCFAPNNPPNKQSLYSLNY